MDNPIVIAFSQKKISQSINQSLHYNVVTTLVSTGVRHEMIKINVFKQAQGATCPKATMKDRCGNEFQQLLRYHTCRINSC